jgi:superfamily II DNA/RNA helicase
MLVFFLQQWTRSEGKGGAVLASGYKVRIGEDRGVMPDVQYYGPDNQPSDQPKGLERKVLVFANYDETIENVESSLKGAGYSVSKLYGTYNQMNTVINDFRRSGHVMLINSTRVCAGLNLQFATDIVFMHVMNDRNTEVQVCGRAQRIGRTCNLRIHYLMYNNEVVDTREDNRLY